MFLDQLFDADKSGPGKSMIGDQRNRMVYGQTRR
jgi:hypothetical protein